MFPAFLFSNRKIDIRVFQICQRNTLEVSKKKKKGKYIWKFITITITWFTMHNFLTFDPLFLILISVGKYLLKEWNIKIKKLMINLYGKSFISVIMYVRETRIFEKFPRNKFIIFCTHFKFLFFLPWGLFSSIFSLCLLELPVC